MRRKWVALICELILLCLPAAAPAHATDLTFAGAASGSSFSASIARKVAGNGVRLSAAETAGAFQMEPATGLLVLIGLGLIAGASLIGGKRVCSGAAEEGENSGDTAIYGPHKPTLGISTAPKSGTPAMESMRAQQLPHLSAK